MALLAGLVLVAGVAAIETTGDLTVTAPSSRTRAAGPPTA